MTRKKGTTVNVEKCIFNSVVDFDLDFELELELELKLKSWKTKRRMERACEVNGVVGMAKALGGKASLSIRLWQRAGMHD